MKLKEILENLLDGPEEHIPPEKPANIGVLDKNIQKYIDRAMQEPEAQDKLLSVKVRIDGPNARLIIRNKNEGPHIATIPMLYLKKYLNNPKTLADILLRKGM
jgi:hypothetical protein